MGRPVLLVTVVTRGTEEMMVLMAGMDVLVKGGILERGGREGSMVRRGCDRFVS